ncbi:response regulator [Streptomyces stramineus]|uniref:Response regulator transcription factor n=1 Tax=Streptomyces stramineus TaxID=173861 RepID=A0ABN0ZI93_9ACTN
MIRVLIADGLRLPREALAAVLSSQPGMHVVAQVQRGADVVPSALRARPDVALLDVNLPGTDGVSAATGLKAALPTCRVVLVTAPERPDTLATALKSGVEGCVGKNASVRELAETVRKVARGDRVLDPQIVADALDAPDNPLSRRDIDILRLAARGHTPTEIAEALHLSPGTVRNNLAAINRKVGTRNRIETLRIASARGWI